MTADGAATLVWLSPGPPTASERITIRTWARAHGVELVDPVDDRPSPLRVDPGVASAVDGWLDQAHDATEGRDGPTVDRTLAAAEALLRAHAALPQAAWQMAEIERARAARWRRIPPTDPEAADRAWERAEGLDGGRVTGAGEQAAAARAVAADVVVEARVDQEIWIDARVVVSGPTPLSPGPHALVVTSDGAPVWASWIDVSAGTSIVRPEAPSPPPCSSVDVMHAGSAGNAVMSDRVRCGRWVASTPGFGPGTVRMAMCSASHCGPLLDWQGAPRWAAAEPVRRAADHAGSHWPAWAGWTLAGAGALVAGGAAVLVVEALRSPPSETRFVSGGLAVGK
jgi:hypothetical protein